MLTHNLEETLTQHQVKQEFQLVTLQNIGLPFETENPSVPIDIKETFDQSTGSDSDNEQKKLQRQTIGYNDAIIFDEEYEILSQTEVKQSFVKTCPFCYEIVDQDIQLIYSAHLTSYFPVHRTCCEKYQAKDMGYKLHSFNITDSSEIITSPTSILENILLQTLDEVKVFTQIRVYHPISKIPFIQMNEISQLQYKKHQNDGIVQIDYSILEMQNRLYQTKLVIPMMEARIEFELFIFDQQLINQGKQQINFELTYLISSENLGKIHLKSSQSDNMINLQGNILQCNKEEIIKLTNFNVDQKYSDGNTFRVLDVQKIQFTINGLIRNNKHISCANINTPAIKTSPNSNETIIFNVFTPKTQPLTPLLPPVSTSPQQQQQITEFSRGRLPSLNLNEDSEILQSPQTSVMRDDWGLDDITNIEQIRGSIIQFVKTQQGSRLIQKFFTTCTQSELDIIIREIEDQIPDLMIDPYANYLFGSLSQSCVPQQRIHILRKISPRLVEIACDKKGTHAVQALVSLISSRTEEELIQNAIQNQQVIQLIFDSQGTHLIKKIISRFSEERLCFVFDRIMDFFLPVVNHQYGLCVLKDLMTKFKNNNDRSNQIIKKLLNSIDEVIQDPYGNYAIQHALDVFGDQKCLMIIEKTLQKIVQLSIHKYSSNVVEKCILETSQTTRRKFICLLAKEEINIELMKNKFGSFVLQKTLSVAKADRQLFNIMLTSLYRNLSQLYAANIRQKWQDYLDQVSMRKRTLS